MVTEHLAFQKSYRHGWGVYGLVLTSGSQPDRRISKKLRPEAAGGQKLVSFPWDSGYYIILPFLHYCTMGMDFVAKDICRPDICRPRISL